MKRTKIFTLVMAIFWTVIAVLAVVLLMQSGEKSNGNIALIFLAVVAVVGNWMRYFKNR